MALTPDQQAQLESITIDFVFGMWAKYQAARQRALDAGINPATLEAAMKRADAQLETVYEFKGPPPTP